MLSHMLTHKLGVLIFFGLIVSAAETSTFAQTNCRYQKSANSLPPGAPLIDVILPENDDITATEAYRLAVESEAKFDMTAATEFYERAIRAMRNSNGSFDQSIANKIVKRYGNLLREHLGAAKAIQLEKEFGEVKYKDAAFGCGAEPSRIDEKHYTVNRSERHLKTSQPIIEVSPINAFITAQSYERDKNYSQAAAHYELAIAALRSLKPPNDRKLARKIAKKYAHLLHEQNYKSKAKSVLDEFCKRKASAQLISIPEYKFTETKTEGPRDIHSCLPPF